MTDTTDKLSELDEARIRKLERYGHLPSLYEEFETLKAKLVYGKDMDKQEAMRCVLLIKYFIKHAPSESYRIHVQYLYDKFIKGHNL